MKAPMSWLAEFVDIDLEPEALAARLTLLGMEVRGIERRGTEWRNVVVGELLSVTRHPRADRLSLTTVDVGDGAALEIVCGATNIAPGQRVPVALPGAILPGDRRIERTEKMGVVSNGMLCSGDELGLTSDADGILILESSTPIGARLADLYGDVVLDIDVKPNRGDALSIIGLAREVAAITGAPLRWPEITVEEGGAAIAERISVRVEDDVLCPRFVGRWIDGVTVAPSPDRVQMRLLAAGMRPISNVVDASNYVLLELGKPIHTFDAATIRGGTLVVRTARAGERLETLDHVERDLHPETLLIADGEGPLAIAGVMGGAASEVSNATTAVLVESAIFDPVSIRRTAFRYALRSEASLRFEKGQEFRLARVGADRTAQLIAQWAGGTVAAGVIDSQPSEPAPARVAFRPARVNRLLGTELTIEAQLGLLARVGIETEAPAAAGTTSVVVSAGSMPLALEVPASETLTAGVPTWRRDIAIEADVIEEIARVHGYDAIPTTLPSTPMPTYRRSPLELRDSLRTRLAGAGLREVVTHALVAPSDVERFAWQASIPAAAGEDVEGGPPITVTNPLSADHAQLRQSLVPGLVGVIATNRRRGADDVRVFEVGKGYARDDGGAREWWRLGIGLAGNFEPAAWNRAARPADLDDMKGIVEAMATWLGLTVPAYVPLTGEPVLHPGRAATVVAHDASGAVALTGRIGEIHPALVAALDAPVGGAILAELSIRGLSGGFLPVPRGRTPSRHPAVERDLAIVVPVTVPAGAVREVIATSGGTLLQDVRLFDVYRGAPLGADERSLAFRMTFEAEERTLTESEVDGAMSSIVGALTAAGHHIRA